MEGDFAQFDKSQSHNADFGQKSSRYGASEGTIRQVALGTGR